MLQNYISNALDVTGIKSLNDLCRAITHLEILIIFDNVKLKS